MAFETRDLGHDAIKNSETQVDTLVDHEIITELLGTYLIKPGNWYDRAFFQIWNALMTLQDQIYTLVQDVYAEPVVKPKEEITVLKEVYNSDWIAEHYFRHLSDSGIYKKILLLKKLLVLIMIQICTHIILVTNTIIVVPI